MDAHAYPEQLAAFVAGVWPDSANPLPLPGQLVHMLSTAYQASLMRDEGRPVTFRLLVVPRSRLPTDCGPPEGLHALALAQPRQLEPHELRRLAPAAQYDRALLAIDQVGEEFQIHAVLQSGPRWLELVAEGDAPAAAVPAGSLVVLVQGPGRVAVACGETTLAEIRGGLITGSAFDVFSSSWLNERFAPIRFELVAALDSVRSRSAVPHRGIDPGIIRKVSQGMLRRALAAMREARHGGTLLFVSPDDDAWMQFVNLKYGFADGEPRHRYRSLMLRRMRWEARVEAAPSTRDARLDDLSGIDEAIAEMSHLLAGLASVDGAVVLTRQLEILGFGAEIVAVPPLHEVSTALDVEARDVAVDSIDGVGTRHRSVYRFCAAVPDAVATVVSQDGGIQFVANRDGEVVRWEHTAAGSIEV